MSYEVEKRSLFSNIEEFNKCRQFLLDNGIFVKEENFDTFLFTSPSYLRLRIKQGEDFSVVTYKANTDFEGARKEIELKLDQNQTKTFSEILTNIGYRKCAYFTTRRLIFKYEGLEVQLNDIEKLGLILEAEIVTDLETEIISSLNKISEVFKLLKVEEVSLDVYKQLKDKLMSDTSTDFNFGLIKF